MRLLTILCLSFLTIMTVSAEPTRLLIHVKSKDAKFVGSSMGGVQITIRDAQTGELLAGGITQGSTGDTDRIMKEPRERYQPIATPDAAGYLAELDLAAPTHVRIEAYGPLAQRQAAVTVSQTQWIFPGRHLDAGDGIVLELPGFVVDVLSPPAHQKLAAGTPVRLTANVTMMCGCPITPDGLWDANAFSIQAQVLRDGEPLTTVELAYAGEASQFAAEYTPTEPGTYIIHVMAFHAATANTGLDTTTLVVN